MSALFKFRCYQCEKLLGASPSKVGSVVHCPKCGAEIVIPTPAGQEPPPDGPDAELIRLEDLGLRTDPEPGLVPRTRPPAGPDPDALDAMAFLEKVGEAAPEPEAEPEAPSPPAEDDDPGAPDLPDPLSTPLVPRTRGARRSNPSEATARRRDVTLPRTAVVAWALFALLSLGFAFTSGMLIGHYLWR